MLLSLGGVVAGIAILILGGTLLVKGASEIASKFGVPPIVIGLIIVGFGTSSPELLINVFGALRGATDIAFGNVVGSNISNFGLVLGLTAIVAPITIQSQLVRREIPLLILITTIMTVMALDGVLENQPAFIGRSEGIVLMLLFLVFLYINVLDVLRTPRSDRLLTEMEDNPLIEADTVSKHRWLYLLGGFALLFAGGELTVRSGIGLAEALGISATVIGLFVVAVGTSMPELVTSIIAALRGESDLALGNVVGSNIFNSLVVLPASAIIMQVDVPNGGVADLLLSWALVVPLVPIFLLGGARLGRSAGLLLLGVYAAYVILRISYETGAL